MKSSHRWWDNSLALLLVKQARRSLICGQKPGDKLLSSLPWLPTRHMLISDQLSLSIINWLGSWICTSDRLIIESFQPWQSIWTRKLLKMNNGWLSWTYRFQIYKREKWHNIILNHFIFTSQSMLDCRLWPAVASCLRTKRIGHLCKHRSCQMSCDMTIFTVNLAVSILLV